MIKGGSKRTTLSPAPTTQHAALAQRIGKLGVRNLAFQAEQQPLAPHLVDHLAMLVGDHRKLLLKIIRNLVDVLEETRRQARRSSTALPTAIAKRIAAERRTMRARRHAGRSASVARHAPTGNPPPNALAIAMMSGVTPDHSCANSFPVRPMPH